MAPAMIWLRAPGCELVQEALEVIGIKNRGHGAAIAVGGGRARRKCIQKALEVVGVEARGNGTRIAVGVAAEGELEGEGCAAHVPIARRDRAFQNVTGGRGALGDGVGRAGGGDVADGGAVDLPDEAVADDVPVEIADTQGSRDPGEDDVRGLRNRRVKRGRGWEGGAGGTRRGGGSAV